VAETVAGLFGLTRKRSLSSSLTKRRMTSQAKSDVEESVAAIKDIQEQISEIEKEKAAALQAVNDKWGEIANQITETTISAQKNDILLDFFGVAWMPYHLVKIGEQLTELRGFSAK
jgi:seryl-tRNA synthetase